MSSCYHLICAPFLFPDPPPLDLTQEQLAARLLVTPLTVHRWEAGHSKPRRLALDRLRQLEEEVSTAQAAAASADAPWSGDSPLPGPDGPGAAPPLDFNGDPDAVSAVAEALRLEYGHQFNPAFASEISRIDPLPHQRIAVYEHMLPQDPLRFLLADDAGAGKTIMTGLVVRDMLSRGRIRRVLISPPAGLVGNWERELRSLFRLPFRIVSGPDVTAATRTGAGRQPGSPFQGRAGDLAIVSIDTLAGEGVFAALRDPEVEPYDLIVFDEAHKLAASTDNRRTRKTWRYRLAEALAGCPSPHARYSGLGWSARHLLLLTATPHMGKDSPYHHLWRLLDPHVFATGEAFRRFPQRERGRHFLRRTKEETRDLEGRPLYRKRSCDTFSYELAPGPDGEQALYDATTDYLRHVYGQAPGGGAVRLAMGVFQRRLASSSWALLRSFERRAAKLAETAEGLRSGVLAPSDVNRSRRYLDRRYPTDYFDAHGADEDVADDASGSTALGGPAEGHEDFEAAVLGAVVSADIEDLEREIEVVNELAARAKAVVDSGRESKFEKLREVLEDPAHASEKWLIFTEHRDTMDYLVRRLEGLGHAGRVACVHGGMAWPERERQVEHFRDPAGARYLVATDAAGEGMNLQFCAFMANYDIPWNPARLEQRMGRIHRYGQKRDVRIVNLVAGSTREGRVLQVLLEKLEAVRRELASEKVFDVIGRLFEDASLKDYMMEAIADADADAEQQVIERVGAALDGGRVRAVAEADARTYGPPGDVAGRLDGLRDDMEREHYLRRLPAYVRCFVEKSAALLGLDVQGDLDGWFSLAPKRPGALDPLLPALDGYPVEARARLSVRRAKSDAEDGIWLHPGEPVFDALREHVLRTFAPDALRGGIFIDPHAKEPYLSGPSGPRVGATGVAWERRRLSVRFAGARTPPAGGAARGGRPAHGKRRRPAPAVSERRTRATGICASGGSRNRNAGQRGDLPGASDPGPLGRRPTESPGGRASRAPSSGAGGVRPPRGRPGVPPHSAGRQGRRRRRCCGGQARPARSRGGEDGGAGGARGRAKPDRGRGGPVRRPRAGRARHQQRRDRPVRRARRADRRADRCRVGGGAGLGRAGREQARPCPRSRSSRLPRLRPPRQDAERRGPTHRSEGPPGPGRRARNRQRMDPGVPSGRQLLALCSLELRDARADHGPHPGPLRQAARQRACLDHLHDLPQVPAGRGGANLNREGEEAWEPFMWT